MKRNLDGVYFRIKRDNCFENICFSDLTDDERQMVLADKDTEFLKRLCCILADTLQTIGQQLNIVVE